MEILDYTAYHYFENNTGPLANLTMLGIEKALEIIERESVFCKNFKSQYMKVRFYTEELLYDDFIKIGGKPELKHPFYFTVGENQMMLNKYKKGNYMTIPIRNFDFNKISFTYEDSFRVFLLNDGHPTRKKVYNIYNISDIIQRHKSELNEHIAGQYFEIQVWYEKVICNHCNLINNVCKKPNCRFV